MRTLNKSLIPDIKINKALHELKNVLVAKFDVEEIILYGSMSRGEAEDESDIDLLIITNRPFNRFKRHEITDFVFEINLHYGTNFSTLVLDRQSWENGVYTVLPLHKEILKEGIKV